MNKFRAYCFLGALIAANVYCIFGWALAEKAAKDWQQFAIAEDTIIIQQQQAMKHNQESMDWCFERPISTR